MGRVPSPSVPKPKRRQHAARGRIRTPIDYRDPAENVVRVCFGILDLHVKIAVVSEHPGIQQFILEIVMAAFAVLGHQLGIGERRLGILVKHFHEAVGRSAVQIEIIFFDILAVISLGAGQPEHAFLEDRIASVPQRQGKTDILVAIADPGDTVFAPAEGPAAGVVVGKLIPGIAIGAVIFTHGSPGAFAEAGPPFFPIGLTLPVCFESLMLGRWFHNRSPSIKVFQPGQRLPAQVPKRQTTQAGPDKKAASG